MIDERDGILQRILKPYSSLHKGWHCFSLGTDRRRRKQEQEQDEQEEVCFVIPW
jgi:hypothetical protein